MPQRAFQRDLELPAEAVKGKLHCKAPVLSQRNSVGAGHGFAGGEQGCAGLLFVGVERALQLHRGEAVLAGVGLFGELCHILFQPGHAFLIGAHLLRQKLDDLIFQRVLLAEMVGFQELQTRG